MHSALEQLVITTISIFSFFKTFNFFVIFRYLRYFVYLKKQKLCSAEDGKALCHGSRDGGVIDAIMLRL
jgi:hypothetical protein